MRGVRITGTAPAVLSAPVLIGTPRDRTATSFTTGTFSGSPVPDVVIQWLLNTVPIAGATSSIYTPVNTDVGGTLTVKQTATNTRGSVSSTSAGVVVIASDTAAPTLTGSPTLIASWDFNDLTKLTLVSNKISDAAGADGTSYTLSQGTDASRPTRIVLAGYGCAQFSGAQVIKLASSLGVSTTGVITIVAVMEQSTLASSGTVFSLANNAIAGNYNRHRMGALTTASGFNFHEGDNAIFHNANIGTAYPLGRHLVVGMGAQSGGTMRIYQDASTTTGSVASSLGAISVGLTNTALGADQDGDFLNGYVWKLLVYSGQLSTTNVDELATWSNARWGIGGTSSSVGASTITWNAPSDLTGVDGYKVYWGTTRGATTYSATVSGAGTLTYGVTGLTTGTWYFTIRTTASGVEGPDVYAGSKAVA